MGFSEIYVLGCENTSIISNIQAQLEEDTQEYGYNISENEQKRMRSMHKEVSMTQCAHSFYMTLFDYERLNAYCNAHDIKIFNCTPNSIIDSIPKMPLKDVIGKH